MDLGIQRILGDPDADPVLELDRLVRIEADPMIRFLSRCFWLQSMAARLVNLIPCMVIHNLGKYWAIKKAFYLTWLDGTKGDYLEFGVFTGSSLNAALMMAPAETSCYGFDSFEGFGADQSHPFFNDGNFKVDYESVKKRLPKAALMKGFFKDLGPPRGRYPASVILIDCDTFEAASQVFDYIPSTLQEGTIFLLDDMMAYKGHRWKGVYRAFENFKSWNESWHYRKLFDWGIGGEAWIVCR